MACYEHELGDGLVLRTVRDERDAERFATFNAAVVDPREGAACACLLHHRPDTAYGDFLLIEDRRTGQIASTTCLLPCQWRYEDITLDVAQLEMVATHPDYRRRGLVRAQVERFHQAVQERGFDLALIEGIPYYYRQFGYGYALDNWAADSLPSWLIPEAPGGTSTPYQLRPATAEDADVLTRLYGEAMAGLDISALRGPDFWRYLLQWAHYPVRIVEDSRSGRPAGYICTTPLASGGTDVHESGVTSSEVAMAILRQLKAEAGGEVRLAWPQEGTLVQLGRSLGGAPLPHYQWLLRITDVAALLNKLAPALERRVARSPFAGLTRDVCLNLYRQAYTLHFENGKLRVAPAGFVDASMGADGGDIRLPPEAFVRLVLGYRTLAELWDAWPDSGARPESRALADVLFPRLRAYLCLPHMYMEPQP